MSEHLSGMEKARLQMIAKGRNARASFWFSTTARLFDRGLLTLNREATVTLTPAGRKALEDSPATVLAWRHGTSENSRRPRARA